MTRSIASWVHPYRAKLAWGLLALVATQAMEKTLPMLLRYGIDGLQAGHREAVTKASIAVIALALVGWFVRSASRIGVFNVGRDVEYDLRNAVLAKVHSLGVHGLQRRGTGDLMSRATNDLVQVRLYVGFGLLNGANSLLSLSSALVLMLWVSPELTAWSLIPYAGVLLTSVFFAKAMFRRSNAAQAALAALAERVQESVSGTRVIRSLGIEPRMAERFEQANQDVVRNNVALSVLRSTMWPLLQGFAALGILGSLLVGGQRVIEGSMSIGELTAFQFYLQQLVWPTLALGYLVSVLSRGQAAYERIVELLDAPLSIEEPAEAVSLPERGALRVEALSYAIEGRTILDAVSFDVPEGESLAIVGTTGSGKSTLAGLLTRLLPTPPRAVFIGGVDITTAAIPQLRTRIGYAQQEPFLFSTTIEENLRLSAGAEASGERLEEALRKAAVDHDVDRMPERLQTVVGERGVQLSGGQKQRVALARALLHDPRILVLDDPMSAVDAKTEAVILASLERLIAERSVVIITHRVAVARRASRVLVLDGGRVVETGTHDELVARDGLYARLAEHQRIERELETSS